MAGNLSQYLVDHEHDDPIKILLANKDIAGHPAAFVANQLDCRKRAKDKLPSWYANPEIVYPPKQNLEQCSSETTARYKCSIISESQSNGTIIDLSAGLGVDAFFFSKVFNQVIHVEPNQALCQLAEENHIRLDARNVNYHNQVAEQFLQRFEGVADWVYIDPSRKAEGKKLVRLADCEPNVIQLLPAIWAKANNILIKAAPLLDITEGLRDLPETATVVVVAVSNECREVLFCLRKNYASQPKVVCVNLHAGAIDRFEFQFHQEAEAVSTFSEPQTFLYEPNAALLKAGAFKSIGQTFKLHKLAVSTHLYTSSEMVPHFPGKIFKILGDVSQQKQWLPDNKANIISRNHPLSPADIQKKYKIQDGGAHFVIACSTQKKKYLLIAERVR